MQYVLFCVRLQRFPPWGSSMLLQVAIVVNFHCCSIPLRDYTTIDLAFRLLMDILVVSRFWLSLNSTSPSMNILVSKPISIGLLGRVQSLRQSLWANPTFGVVTSFPQWLCQSVFSAAVMRDLVGPCLSGCLEFSVVFIFAILVDV